MPDFIKGSSPIITFSLTYQGSPAQQAVAHVDVYNPSGVKIVENMLASEIANEPGVYGYQFATALTLLGTYRATWRATYLTLPFESEAIFTVGNAPFGALTLGEVRHLLLDTEMDDHWQGAVTAATGSGVTVPDLSGYPAGHFRGAFLYIYGGTGRGQERVLTDSSEAGVLSVASWAVQPNTTSLIELHKKHSVSRVNRAIKRASEDALMRQWVPMTDESLVVTDAEETHYQVPSGFVAIHDMQVRDSAGALTHIRQSSLTYKEGWDILVGTRQIVLPPQPLGFVLVLHGSALAGSPEHDDSLVEIDPEYLISAACAILERGGAGGQQVDPDNQMQKSLVYGQLAMAKLKRLGQRIPSGSRRL